MQRIPISLSDKRYDEIADLVRKSYKKSCILFIDEVVNNDLYSSYEKYKSEILEKRGQVDEKLVFHGTKAEYIDSIIKWGFDPTKNITSAHGKGTYFAKNADYSKAYMKTVDSNEISYMFLAKISLGKCVVGKNNQQKRKGDDFENFVNTETNPTIYVCPDENSAYPQYVIAFYKNAT